uniref:Uncharacterized LOC113140778 n=1 Tax=Mastacembelus armatus TaxID=205130 RepID=A0A3Q3LEN2_9TELE
MEARYPIIPHQLNRYEKARECRRHLEEQLSNLRLLEKELRVHKLPELQSQLNNQTEQLMELQRQHQQDMQSLQGQLSGDIVVELQTAKPSYLIQQLGNLRKMSVMLLDKNRNECCFDTQVSMLRSPEVTFEASAGSRVNRADVEELRKTAAHLEEELKQLQALNTLLEASGLEQREVFFLQLVALQQRADGLFRDLDSVLQTAAQQSADYQTLLDVKSQLDTEIQNYRRLLDQIKLESPAVSRRHVPLDRRVNVQGRFPRIRAAQSVLRDHIYTVQQTPVPFLRSNTATRVRSNRVHTKHPKNSPDSTNNTANQTDTFHKSIKVFPTGTGRESKTMNSMIKNRQNSPMEDKVHVEDCDVQKPLIFCTQISQDTETVISAQLNSDEGKVQATNENLAQLKSYKLETPSRALTDTGQLAVTAFKPSGSHLCWSKEAQVEVFGEMTIMDNKQIDAQEAEAEETSLVLRLDQRLSPSDVSNSEQNQLTEDADRRSGIAAISSSSPDCTGDLESKNATIEVLKKVELELNNGINETKTVKTVPTELVNTWGQEALLWTTESKSSSSLTDSGVALSSPDLEELLSPTVTDVFLSPTKTVASLSPDTCLRPFEVDVLINTTDQEFCPVYVEDQVTSADMFLHPIDSETYPSPNHSAKHLKPVETKGFQSPNTEDEDEEACMSLTEANVQVRPVEKYILLTKEENQSLSFSGERDLPEEDRHRGVTISVKDGGSLCFGSFETNEGGRPTQDSTNTNLRPSNQGIGFHLSTSLEGLVFGGPGNYGIIADKEQHGHLWGKDAIKSKDRYKNANNADNKDGQSPGGTAEGKHGSEEQKEISVMSSGVDSNLGDVAACNSSMANDHAVSFSGTAEGTVISNAKPVALAGVCGRFSGGSGEWMVHGGSLGHTGRSLPRTESEESQSVAPVLLETENFSKRKRGEWMVYGNSHGYKRDLNPGTNFSTEGNEKTLVTTLPTTSPPEKGRFGRRGSDEWMVYGGVLGHKSSLDARTNLSNDGNERNPLLATLPATSPPVTRRFGRSGSGEWLVYGGSLEDTDRLDPGTSLSSEGNEKSPSPVTLPGTSPPETGRFRSRGNGEWMIFGGRFGHKGSLDGSASLPSEVSEESVSVATKPVTSPPETGRFGSSGNGKWLVYGGSLGHRGSMDKGVSLLSTGSEDSFPVATLSATTQPETGRFDSRGSGECMVHSGSPKTTSLQAASGGLLKAESDKCLSVLTQLATSLPETRRYGSEISGERMVYGTSPEHTSNVAGTDNLPNMESEAWLATAKNLAKSPPGPGRFGSRGSGEWIFYGGNIGLMSSPAGTNSFGDAGSEESPSVDRKPATSPTRVPRAGRFGSGGSGEWRVFGGSTGRLSSPASTDTVSVSTNEGQIISPPNSYTHRGPRLSKGGSGGRLSSGSVVRRSSSVGSGGSLSSSGSGGDLTNSPGSHRISRSGKYTSTGSGEWKPIYSSASGRRSSVGSPGRSGGGRTTSSQRTPSPGGKTSVSGGSLGSRRTNSTGGRVICSSDWPIRNTGSRVGGSKERISVCKMAALSISAAVRERSQERQRQAQQRTADTSPLVRRWLSTGVAITSVDPDGLDDIMDL